MIASNCVGVSGAGTPASPFQVALVLSSEGDNDNLIECTANGLYARAPVQSDEDVSIVVTEGPNLGDYEFAVAIDTEDGNQLVLGEDGLRVPLFANIRLRATDSALFGGSPPDPAENVFVEDAGSVTDTTNVAGHIVVTLPGGSMDGILSITYSILDVPGVISNHSIDFSTVAADHFDVVFQHADGTPISGGTYRIAYRVLGWVIPV